MRPWVGYARVSHVGGRAGDSFRSPDDQCHAIEQWASARGERVVMLDPELDESGGRADRPILQQAIEGIEAGKYRGLVVAYLSRASRSTRHLLELWDRIEDAGGQVMSVAENIDTSTPAGRLTRTMMVAIAEHELDGHRERFEALRRNATMAGVWQRRQVPLGYVKGPDRRLTPSDDAPRVVAAFSDRLTGKPLVHLARELSMTASGVRALLRNRVYLGELRVGAHVNPAAHPAIVGVDLFEQVQATHVARSPGPGRDPALLAGVARCAGCGHVMSRQMTAAVVYSCAVNHSRGKCLEPASITAHLVDDYVTEVALREFERARMVPSEDVSLLEEARADLAAAERELAAFLDGVAAAGISPVSYAKALADRQAVVDEKRSVVTDVLARRPVLAGTMPVAQAWELASVRERNQLLRSLVETVLIRRAGGRGRFVPVADRVRLVRVGTGLVVNGAASDGHDVRGFWVERGDPGVVGE